MNRACGRVTAVIWVRCHAGKPIGDLGRSCSGPECRGRSGRELKFLTDHSFTRIWFNPSLRFLLTFAKNTHRIKAFRLVQRVSLYRFDTICSPSAEE